MGVRKQHVKSTDILHVWIWYPPHARAYSQSTAANFFVFWTRCQWLIKHTAYHLNTALTLFLFFIFFSQVPQNINSYQWLIGEKKKLPKTTNDHCGPPGSRTRMQLWPGWPLHQDMRKEKTMTRPQFPRVMGQCRSWKFTFVLGLMK